MSKQTEALKLALEALEECRRDPRLKYEHPYYDKTITTIREALAEQPAQQQEPVAYASDVEFDDETEIIPAEQKGKLGTAGLRIPLYIDPPASKPLTDEQIKIIWRDIDGSEGMLMRFARAIEAAHGIKGDA